MINYNWKILQRLVAIIPTVNFDKTLRIYLTSPEKQQYISLASKNISYCDYKKVEINNNSFKLKIDYWCSSYNNKYSIDIYVKSNELPNPEDWYKVENIHESSIGSIITQADIKDGLIEGNFEAIFSNVEEAVDKISFISPKMKEYGKCLEETQRVLNCEIFSKTKKYIPGHRYDSISETRYYLCPVLTSKENLGRTELIEDPEQYKQAYLYVNNIDTETEKTVSDILKSRPFGNSDNSIKIGFNSPLMVDSGELLGNDFSGNVQDYWDYFIDNTIDSQKATLPFGYTYINDISQLLNIFTCFSENHIEIRKDWKDRLIPILIESLRYVICLGWENPVYKYVNISLQKNNSIEENTENLYKILVHKLTQKDPNILKSIFYEQLLNTIGIDIKALAIEVLSEWDINKLINSFEDFLKYSFYFELRNNVTINTTRQKTAIDVADVNTLAKLYGESELTKIIRQLIEYAKDNLGQGVDEFTSVNLGTKKSPIKYITCRITLENLYKYLNGKFSKELQDNIMNFRFTSIVIVFDDSKINKL